LLECLHKYKQEHDNLFLLKWTYTISTTYVFKFCITWFLCLYWNHIESIIRITLLMKMTPHVYVCKHILTSILFLLSTHVVCFSMVLFLIIYLKTQELFFQLEIPFHLNAILVLCFGLCLIFNLLLCKIII
jgi:hypothetical protein